MKESHHFIAIQKTDGPDFSGPSAGQFMTLQHLSAMTRGRNWHLASAGCQGFTGPVPPPFWISRDETDKDPAKSNYAAIGPDCQEGDFGLDGLGWLSAHPATSASRTLTCRLPR